MMVMPVMVVPVMVALQTGMQSAGADPINERDLKEAGSKMDRWLESETSQEPSQSKQRSQTKQQVSC